MTTNIPIAEHTYRKRNGDFITYGWPPGQHPYRQHLIDSGQLTPDALTPCGVWLDTAPCLDLGMTEAERRFFKEEALEWLQWWESGPPNEDRLEWMWPLEGGW